MSITRAMLVAMTAAAVTAGSNVACQAAPLSTNLGVMKSMLQDDTTLRVRWGVYGGGWGYRGFGYRGFGYRGWGYRPLGWGALAAGAVVGGAIASSGYYGSYPYYGYGANPSYYGGGYGGGCGCNPYGGFYQSYYGW